MGRFLARQCELHSARKAARRWAAPSLFPPPAARGPRYEERIEELRNQTDAFLAQFNMNLTTLTSGGNAGDSATSFLNITGGEPWQPHAP